MKKVLIVGGSGYLGQFLVESLSKDQQHYEVAFTYHHSSKAIPDEQENSQENSYQVDLSSGSGLESISTEFGEPEVVINCAAISQPRVCEEKGDLARSVNVPSKLVEWLLERFLGRPLLVHLSTDHVYEGSKALNREAEEEGGGGGVVVRGSVSGPVNAYGQSKKESEDYVQNNYANHIILRSSIIYGKSKNVSRNLFLQWMSAALGGDAPVGFFTNEFRSPIYVMDIVRLVRSIILNQTETGGGKFPKIFNLGGPERLSRFDMAKILCQHCGYDPSNVQPVERPAGVKAPLDASMDITRLRETFDFEPMSYTQALHDIFPKKGSSV